MTSDVELEELIAELPEVYQPLYGVDARLSSRPADLPRMDSIARVADLLTAQAGRPLRVLDLGSAQGYLAFVLAERGHHVTGIDYLAVNVRVSQALQARHPQLDVEFVEGDIADEGFLRRVGRHDLVLGLSVLHHVVHRDGLARAIALVEELRDSAPHGLFEMALRDEPQAWGELQPADPRVVLAPYPFMRRLGSSSTHLSEIERPLLFCSVDLAMANGALYPIRSWTDSPHAGAQGVKRGLCRYFTLDVGLMKVAARYEERADEGHLQRVREELQHEAEMLRLLGKDECAVAVPEVVEASVEPDENVLVKTMLPGELVSELNPDLDVAARTRITDDVLTELACYEELGWYHTDLRLWNVLWDAHAGAAHLIDHGALQREMGDVVWPGDAAYSLAVFVSALWSGSDDLTGQAVSRTVSVGPDLPASAMRMLRWMSSQRRSGTFFRAALEEWRRAQQDDAAVGRPTLGEEWLAALGENLGRTDAARAELREALASSDAELGTAREVLEATSADRDHIAEGYRRLEETHADALAGYRRLHDVYDSTLESYQRQDEAYSRALQDIEDARAAEAASATRVAELEARVGALDEHVTALESSISWRLTRPLRAVRRAIGRPRAAP